MGKTKEPINPFYLLVVALGVVFVVTTFAYGTMAYRAVAQTGEEHGLMRWLDQYGVEILGVELGLLAGSSFGAMWLDGVRSRRREDHSFTEPPGVSGGEHEGQ